MDRGHPSRGAREGPGAGQLGQGHESEELRKDHPATLLTRKPAVCLRRGHLEAFSPLGTSCFVWLWGRSVSRVGCIAVWRLHRQGTAGLLSPPGSSSVPFAFFLQHIYKVIKTCTTRRPRDTESIPPALERRVTMRGRAPLPPPALPPQNTSVSSTTASRRTFRKPELGQRKRQTDFNPNEGRKFQVAPSERRGCSESRGLT